MLFAPLCPRVLISFVALILIHDGVDGVQITGRRSGGDDSSREHSSSSSTQSHTSMISTTPLSVTTSISFNNTASTSMPSSTSSLLPAFTSISQVRSPEARRIGTIVGAVLGSVILASLGLVVLAKYIGRARKARKRPRGSTYVTDQSPKTEMSQIQNGPLLIPCTPLAHHPVPIQFFNVSPSNNTYSPSSPLIPPTTFHNSPDTASSSRPRLLTSDPDGSSHAPSSPLQAAGSASSSTSGQLSPLHHGMTQFQKALEADHKGYIPDQNPSTTITDPPPKYVD